MQDRIYRRLFIYCQKFDVSYKLTYLDWMLGPFSSENTEESPKLQNELLYETTNDDLEWKFKNYDWKNRYRLSWILGLIKSPICYRKH